MGLEKKILVIVDEKASSFNQAIGLTNSIIKYTNYKYEKIVIKFNPFGFRLLPNFFIYYFLKLGLISFNYELDSSIKLIISCGRVCAPLSIILKAKLKCKNIHILKPYFLENLFDKFIIPKHDNFHFSPNLINNRYSFVNEERKNITPAESNAFKRSLPIIEDKKIITVLIGGPSKSSSFTISDANRLIDHLLRINLTKFQLFILPSRRTPKELRIMIMSSFKSFSYIWDGSAKNPYWFLIKNSDFFIVTSDSVSMTSEAISTSKPVFVFDLDNSKNKINVFQNSLRKEGITRKFDGKIFSWEYKKIDEIKEIASSIIEEFNLY